MLQLKVKKSAASLESDRLQKPSEAHQRFPPHEKQTKTAAKTTKSGQQSTVDGSEIPKPSTWDGAKTLVNNGDKLPAYESSEPSTASPGQGPSVDQTATGRLDRFSKSQTSMDHHKISQTTGKLIFLMVNVNIPYMDPMGYFGMLTRDHT